MPLRPSADLSALSEPLRQCLRKQLHSGERVLWVGQPDPRRSFRQMLLGWAIFIVPVNLALLWFMFCVVDFVGALWLAPVLLIGIYGLFAPLRFLVAPATLYAVTTGRALKIRGKMVTAFAGDYIDCVENKDGWGDLILFFEVSEDRVGDKSTRRDGFEHIPEVRKVARLVEALRKS